MESLRLLLVILMSQLEVRAPDQEIATDHAQVLTSLLSEVQNQKNRIEQMSKMLQGRTLSGSPRKHKAAGSTRAFDIGDLSDESWDLEEPNLDKVTQQSLEMNSNVTSASSNRTSGNRPPLQVSHPAPRPSTPAIEIMHSTQENQIALTAQALESWGNKRASWGKTHNGTRYAEIYEQYPSYVTWIRARAGTANAAMQDFIMYIQARESLERQALRGNA